MGEKKQNNMKDTNSQVIVPLCDLKNKPNPNAALETQILYGERVKVIKHFKEWSYCKSLEDNYEGWLVTKNLDKCTNLNYKVLKPISHLYSEPNIKSKIISFLYFNSKINVLSKTKNWCSILYDKKETFIFRKHIVDINKTYKDWVRLLVMFENTPYLWGGKSVNGIDCSGLVQLSLNFCGIQFPRNANEQCNENMYPNIKIDKIKKGCLIFWDGHVGVGLNQKDIIHSNAFHLSVKIENFKKASDRIKKNYGPIKLIKNYTFLK